MEGSHMQSRQSRIAAIGLSMLAAAALAACDRAAESRLAGAADPQDDKVLAQADRKMDTPAAPAALPVDKAKDAAITAEVKSLLAKDNKLGAISIDVQTQAGQVTLRGTAADEAAREHAAALARSISGVTAVDNQLTAQ
jgi:hyperosmotically inducible periplasmic protein